MVGLTPVSPSDVFGFLPPPTPTPTCVTPIDDTGRMGRRGVGPPFSRQLGGMSQR